MRVSNSLDNVPNKNVVTELGTDQPTNQQTDQLLELLEWLFATKKQSGEKQLDTAGPGHFLKLV